MPFDDSLVLPLFSLRIQREILPYYIHLATSSLLISRYRWVSEGLRLEELSEHSPPNLPPHSLIIVTHYLLSISLYLRTSPYVRYSANVRLIPAIPFPYICDYLPPHIPSLFPSSLCPLSFLPIPFPPKHQPTLPPPDFLQQHPLALSVLQPVHESRILLFSHAVWMTRWITCQDVSPRFQICDSCC